jgi:hypothetical protein
VKLEGEEWSSDIPVISGTNTYAVVTVAATGSIDKAVMSETRQYRCVFQLVT